MPRPGGADIDNSGGLFGSRIGDPIACCCSSEDCRVNGCRIVRDRNEMARRFNEWTPPKPHGCVCPPGSEATCKGFGCPRRPPNFISTGI